MKLRTKSVSVAGLSRTVHAGSVAYGSWMMINSLRADWMFLVTRTWLLYDLKRASRWIYSGIMSY